MNIRNAISVIVMASAAAMASAAPWGRLSNPDEWNSAAKGICITNIVCEAGGLRVYFTSDVPPPYRVGIHAPREVGFGTRAQPIAYVDTTELHAFVPCNLYDAAVFVQVYKCDRYTTPSWTRKRTEREWKVYVDSLQVRPIRTVTDQSWYGNPPEASIEGMDPTCLSLVGDHTWGGFVMTDATSLSADIQLVKPGVTNVLHVTASGRDPAVGTGFRVLVFDDTATCQASVAYSAKPNMSQEVLIKRGWKSLSSNGSWKIASDWEGAPVMVPCTNATPYVIYGEGL